MSEIEEILKEWHENYQDIHSALPVIEALQAQLAALKQERDELKALIQTARDYDAVDGDGEFEPPHPVFMMAQDIDTLRAKVRKLKGMIDNGLGWEDMRPSGHACDCFCELCLAPTTEPSQTDWINVEKAGQIKEGYRIKCKCKWKGSEVNYRVKEVLNEGTDREEILIGDALYFITSMAIDGTSWAKNVKFAPSQVSL